MRTVVCSRVNLMLAAAGALLALGLTGAASALEIELRDVAPDRIERQRAANDGRLPLPDTPDLANLSGRIKARGLEEGAAILVRIFKAESQLELWMRKGDQFVLFDTYPICHWSGTIGPKLEEADKQSPEGFYTVGRRQLHRSGRWPHALNLGYPNAFDRLFRRTGSYILVHGGCTSIGCFAMTNPVVEEIFRLTEQALKGGQERVQFHVFPFRMSEANLARHGRSEWVPFWRNLKEGYDLFEATKLPPKISACDGRYVFEAAKGTDAARGGSAADGNGGEKNGGDKPEQLPGCTTKAVEIVGEAALHSDIASWRRRVRAGSAQRGDRPGNGGGSAPPATKDTNQAERTHRGAQLSCDLTRASCRKFAALQDARNLMGVKVAGGKGRTARVAKTVATGRNVH